MTITEYEYAATNGVVGSRTGGDPNSFATYLPRRSIRRPTRSRPQEYIQCYARASRVSQSGNKVSFA